MDSNLTTTTSLSTTSTKRKNNSTYFPQWGELKKRARTLQISTSELAACSTLEELQKLAKKKFRSRVRATHPDQAAGANHRRAKYGVRLNAVVAAYQWICEIEQEKLDRINKNRVTVADIEIPMDWGVGWKEYDSYYSGYTILPRI